MALIGHRIMIGHVTFLFYFKKNYKIEIKKKKFIKK